MLAEFTLTLPDLHPMLWVAILGVVLIGACFTKEVFGFFSALAEEVVGVIASLPHGGRFTVAFLGGHVSVGSSYVYLMMHMWGGSGSNMPFDGRVMLTIVSSVVYLSVSLVGTLAFSDWCDTRRSK